MDKRTSSNSSQSSGVSLSPKNNLDSVLEDVFLPKDETLRLRKNHLG